MKAVLIIIASIIAITLAFESVDSDAALRSEFIGFQHKYGKIYATADDFEMRYNVFKRNYHHAQKMSEQDPKAKYGITKFSDMTPEEFKNIVLMKKTIPSGRAHKNVFSGDLEPVPQGTTFDWRNKGGVVTPVYNQQQCGSCWAFSITENIESQWALAGNQLTSLSMQQVVSCDTNDDGCGGGDPPTAYEYVIEAGLESYNSYPYASGEGESGTCNYNSADVVAHITGYTTIGSEQQAQSYLTQNGPLSVCVDAESWQYYTGGIITTESNCGTSLDHCVMITGYGNESGTNYWWVRNSWGTDWGQSGYLQVESGADVCGIAQEITSATGA